MKPTQIYFLIYNIVSWAAWIYLALLMVLHMPSKFVMKVDKAQYKDFAALIDFYDATLGTLIFIQLCQLIEIVHSFLGIVRSNPIMGIVQIGGRLHCIFLAMSC